MKRFSTVPDLMYNANNGVIFVVPLPLGRLKSITRTTSSYELTGWLFSDHEDHDQRLGTAEEGQSFVDACVRWGTIVVEAKNLNVPFSNGPRRRGEHEGRYTPDEHALVRKDLPNLAELMHHLANRFWDSLEA